MGVATLVLTAGISAEPIKIRVVDGRNGHPITDEKLQLWFDRQSGGAMSIATDKQGVAKVDAPAGSALILSANIYTNCWYSKQTGPKQPTYSVSSIVRSGVSGANTCGTVKVLPRPGELIFFVRPEHWWEGMKR